MSSKIKGILLFVFGYILMAKAIFSRMLGHPSTAPELTSFNTQLNYFKRYGSINVIKAILRSGKNLDGEYFVRVVKAVYSSSRKITEPYSIIEVTNACPHDCANCYIQDRRSTAWMSEASLHDAIRRFRDSALILIQGGEPLTSNYAPRLANVLQQYPDQCFVIVTNGAYINRFGMSVLSKIPTALYAVSINGTKELNDSIRFEGSYDSALGAMTAIRNSGQYFVPVVTLSTDNYLDATSEEFLRNLSEVGAKDVKYIIEESSPHRTKMTRREFDLARNRALGAGNIILSTFDDHSYECRIRISSPAGDIRYDRTGFGGKGHRFT